MVTLVEVVVQKTSMRTSLQSESLIKEDLDDFIEPQGFNNKIIYVDMYGSIRSKISPY